MATLLPPPALFVNEDIAKAENRVNLALFGLMLIPAVRIWVLDQLKLPMDSTIYPPQNVGVGRPDLVVVSSDNRVVAWIEIELGGENSAQLAAYRRALTEPIKSIVGPTSAGGDLSLEQIASMLNESPDGFDAQQAVNIGVFSALIAGLSGKTALWEYADPREELRVLPLPRVLGERLGDVLRSGTPPISPGTAQISTITQKG